jgi:hypothetical protein
MQQTKEESFTKPGFILATLVVLIGGGAITYFVKNATHIHTPYLIAVAVSLIIGILQTKKGWIWAIALCIVITIGYFLILGATEHDTAKRELELFGLAGALLLTFVGSFLGAFIKRAVDS